jgi:uncharacterized protein YdaU (DUF1376 family)
VSDLPYMPVTVAEEHAETAELTNEELGALTRIKWALWRADGFLDLASDPNRLIKISRAGKRWGKIAPAILRLLNVAGGKVSSPSLLRTLCITHERRAKKSRSGGTASRGSDTLLKRPNPLKTNKPDGDLVGRELAKDKDNYKNSLFSSGTEHVAAQEAFNEEGRAAEGLNETLYKHGTELLVNRVGLNALQGRAQISRWLIKIDAPELARLLADADQFGLQGPHFVTIIDQRVDEIMRERDHGPSFRFGHTPIRSSRQG